MPQETLKTVKIPCTVMRGGTSKGLFFMERDLPPVGQERDTILLRAMGSPDRRQIDGMGGADPLTSKVAIISPSERPDADIDYTFAQVDLHKAIVGYGGNCGNISSATGLFAIQEGLAKVTEPKTVVRVYNTNTKKVLLVHVPCRDGAPEEEGTYSIDGVPGTGPRIDVDFSLTTGSFSGKLLPTGNLVDTIDVPEVGPVECTIMDMANPVVFICAERLGLSGRELPADIEKMPEMKKKLEAIRMTAGDVVKIPRNPGLPLLAFVSLPAEGEKEYSIIGRLMFMGVMHEAYSATAAVCTAVACRVKGTIALTHTQCLAALAWQVV